MSYQNNLPDTTNIVRHAHSLDACHITINHTIEIGNVLRYILPPVLFFVSMGVSIFTKGQYPVIQYSTGGFAFASVMNLIRKPQNS